MERDAAEVGRRVDRALGVPVRDEQRARRLGVAVPQRRERLRVKRREQYFVRRPPGRVSNRGMTARTAAR